MSEIDRNSEPDEVNSWERFLSRQCRVAGPVPPVAPDAPLSARVDPSNRWRGVRRDFWNDGPSWLTSMVLHVLWFFLITSLAVPWSSGGGRSAVITLTAGFQDAKENSTAQNVRIPQSQSRVNGGQSGLEKPTDPGEDDSATERPKKASRQTKHPSRPKKELTQFDKWLRQAMQPAPSQQSKYEALIARTRRVYPLAPRSAVYSILDVQQDEEQRRLDKIVDDFIEYDIGQLRGNTGRRARQRFHALGPEAVPALIRGLNKSASIHASCPVGVIAGKLISALRNTDDGSLIQFAIDNVGVGVSPDAPHYARIQALRDRWLKNLQSVPDRVVAALSTRGMQSDGEMIELVLALSDSPAPTVAAALGSDDDRLCLAAMLALQQGQRKFTDLEHGQLMRALLRLSGSNRENEIQKMAGQTLTQLQRRPQSASATRSVDNSNSNLVPAPSPAAASRFVNH